MDDKKKNDLDELFGTMRNHNFEEIKSALEHYDVEMNFEPWNDIMERNIFKDIQGKCDFPLIQKRTVLGFDILGYSQMERERQSLIPFLLSLLLNRTYDSLIKTEKFLFSMYDMNKLKKGFIHTGDGGFQVLPNPLYGIVFAIHFEMNLRSFNSGRIYPHFSKYLKGIKVRYTETFDDLYRYDGNFFGPAIIKASRIISKDRLNRFLMDQGSYDFFLHEFNGVETLSMINLEMVQKSKYFEKLWYLNYDRLKGIVIRDSSDKGNSLDTIIVQDIGFVDSKSESYRVYNFYCQFAFNHSEINSKEPNKKFNQIKVSLGNLNPQGLV
jgi:hypothetical protein